MSKDKLPPSYSNTSHSSSDNVVYFPVHYPPPQSDDDTIDLIELLLTLWKYRKFIVALSLVSLVSAGAYLVGWHFFGKKTYEAEVKYRVIYGDDSKLGGYLRTREFLTYFVEKEELTPVILADIYDESENTYLLPEGIESHFSPAEFAAVQLMGDEKNPTFKFIGGEGGYKTIEAKYSEPVIVARLANRLIHWFEIYNREELLKSAKLSLDSTRMTADRVGVGKLAMKEPADLLVVNSNVLSRLQERLLRQKMQLDLLEQINPQSAEILPIKAEVETIEEKLSSLQESKNENSNREAETLAGLRIQLARQETYVKRLQEVELPLLEIVDSAVVPIEPSNSPKTALILGLSGLVGFFGSILLAFLIDFIQKLRTQYTTNLSVNPKLTQES